MTREQPRGYRWSPNRKLAVLLDAIGADEVMLAERYGLTSEEFDEWRRAYAKRGIAGLCVTKRERNRP